MVEKRRLKKEFIIVLIGRIVLSISGILLLSVLLAFLDTREYSLYVLMFSLASWLSALFFVAANIPFLNFISNNKANSSITDFELKNTALITSVLSFPVTAVISSMGAYIVIFYMDRSDLNPSVLLCMSIGLLSSGIGCVNINSTYLMGKRKRISNTIVTSGFILIRVTFIAVAAVVFNNTAETILYAVAIAAVSGLAVSVFIAYRPFDKPKLQPAFKALVSASMGKSYFENWPVAVGNNVFLFGDKVFLAFFLPIETIGLISVYQQFCRMLANLTSGAIYQFSAPILLNTDDKKSKAYQFYLTSLFSVVFFAIFAVPSYFVLIEVNELLLHGKFIISSHEYSIVAITIALNATSRITELNFFKMNKVRRLHIPMLLSILSFVTLGFFLSTSFGVIGGLCALMIAAIVRLTATSLVQSSKAFS